MQNTTIELSHFTACLENLVSIILKWETASERNAKQFDIERSYETLDNWKYIGKVDVKGNSNETVKYHFRDQKIDGNFIYYRLKMWDLDGLFEYSDVKIIKIKPSKGICLFPNPVSNQLNIELKTLQSSEISFSLFDTTNRLIWIQKYFVVSGSNSFSFSLENLSKGVYFLSMEDGENQYLDKFIIQ